MEWVSKTSRIAMDQVSLVRSVCDVLRTIGAGMV
jgi:hypothetical protein